MSLAPTPELPPEIVDAIIDQLASDTETLRSCILVAQAWVPRSRTHLFRHIQVQGRSSLHRFLKRLQVFGPGAHSLTLKAIPHESPYCKMGAQADLASFTSLTWLFLHGIEFSTFHALAQLMESSPSLEKIALVDVRWSESGERPSSTQRLPCLRQLHISCLDADSIFDWLGCHELPELHHVGITLSSSDARILGFLAKLTVDYLEIGPDNAPGFRSLVDRISAKHGLAVHSTMYYDRNDSSRYEILRRPLPPHTSNFFVTRLIRLTHTSIFCDLQLRTPLWAEPYDWEGLDYIFTSSRFTTVQRFVLLCSPLMDERVVRNSLPVSNRRGVLAFSRLRYRIEVD